MSNPSQLSLSKLVPSTSIDAPDKGKASSRRDIGKHPPASPRKIKPGSRAGTRPSSKSALDKALPNKTAVNQRTRKEASKTPTTAIRPITKGTKHAKLVALLERKTGATIEQISERLSWQAHTARAALTGLRKRGYTIERLNKDGKASCYLIRAMAEA